MLISIDQTAQSLVSNSHTGVVGYSPDVAGRLLSDVHEFGENMGRPGIHTMWEHPDGYLHGIRRSLTDGDLSVGQVLGLRNKIWSDFPDHPQQAKLGLHLTRATVWGDSDVADDWLDVHASNFLRDLNPRVRHSALWVTRAALWQDKKISDQVLNDVVAGLGSDDDGVKRTQMWLLGDIARLDPDHFERALSTVGSLVDSSVSESFHLFALERFFGSVEVNHGENDGFKSVVRGIGKKFEGGYPGVQMRVAHLLDEQVEPRLLKADRRQMLSRLQETFAHRKPNSPLNFEDLESITTDGLDAYNRAKTFLEGLNVIKALGQIVWAEPVLGPRVFNGMKSGIFKNRDGDLDRISTIVLGDVVGQDPETMFWPAVEAVDQYMDVTENDGSQIVLAGILRHSPPTIGDANRATVKQVLSSIARKGANHSVEAEILQMTRR